MATTQGDKLNRLYTHLAPGTPVTLEDLTALGISADLAVYDVRAGWLDKRSRVGWRLDKSKCGGLQDCRHEICLTSSDE